MMIFSRHRAHGFTLIELLIVIFIISIVTATVLITIRFNENKQIETVAKEIAGKIRLAEEQAMLLPSIMGVRITDTRLVFMAYVTIEDAKTKKKKSIWESVDDQVLTNYLLPDGMQASLTLSQTTREKEEEEKKEHPNIIISTNGDITPFTLKLGKVGKQPRYEVVGQDNGNIVMTPLD